ncbi:glycoside hydrolase N-terminal domain-containing protein [Tamlana sp. 2201CG12-4]|uniref:glycoside hydrolase family 95 protein n=1 Tax=Tamlana sp. 2201CG12-4 TaxID=3112582 RepID=UPI002DB5FF1D|nr:glycoside hydrolase N-terminal domain-containing protein [Tamlana sp. 2201CG12-4]MEC3908481.1 glycoside hydrolase N-terminal domain-containing protein [Tamlana sp. 2201CG12-4]
MKLKIKSLSILFSLIGAYSWAQNHNTTLWYEHPAEDWRTQALHLGNGYMGASYYGGIKSERFDITEETMWFGGPGENPDYNYGIREGANNYLKDIRESIVSGDIGKADKLVQQHFTGNTENFGALTSIEQLYLDFENHDGKVSDYKRTLDVANSLATVTYSMDNINYSREYFCSYPDRVMAVHLKSDARGKIGFSIRQAFTQESNEIIVEGNEIHVKGKINGNNRQYEVKIKVLHDGGKLSDEKGTLTLTGANNAILLYTAATEYKAVAPLYNGANPVAITRKCIDKAVKKGYEQLKADHIADYRSLYDRVSLEMDGDPTLEKLPTDKRYEMLKTGMTDDAGLKVLLFNLGRYLLLSASRSGTLPSGLQGVWVTDERAAWAGNYQSNINLQEMYWTAGPLNLPEVQESYINWIKTLIEPGRKVAKAYYGTDGWVSHTTGNIWGFASPGGHMLWGMYPSGAAWHCQHLWSQYEFTQDKKYLKKEAYPIMKEAALFWLQNMVEYEGKYIIAPTVSSEHGVDIRDGKPVEYALTNGEVTKDKWLNLPGAYQDIQMVYDLYSNVMEASEILGIDTGFRAKVKATRDRLLPMRIGKYGQIQEWAWDMDNPRDHHRHIAHMYALMPGRQIDPYKTPELAKAAEISLNMRGHTLYGPKWPHMGGNWNRTWRIWCYTRLLDGEKAARIFNDMVTQVGFENLMAHESNNMQVDGSMSTPGFMAEMMLQSHQGEIHILPAVPIEWPAGKVKGLIARGGFKVDIEWRYGQLVSCIIVSEKGQELPPIRVKGELVDPTKDSRIIIK